MYEIAALLEATTHKYIRFMSSSQNFMSAQVARVRISENYSLHFARKYARICPRVMSVPRSEQFSENVARGKL